MFLPKNNALEKVFILKQIFTSVFKYNSSEIVGILAYVVELSYAKKNSPDTNHIHKSQHEK